MSPRLPSYTGKELIRLLEQHGFVAVRQKGSHVFMIHPDGRTTLIPVHRGQDIGKGLLRSIIRQSEIPFEKFF